MDMQYATSDRALEMARQMLDAPKGRIPDQELARACEYMILVGSPVDKEQAQSRLEAMTHEAFTSHDALNDATEVMLDTWTERFVGLLAVAFLVWAFVQVAL
mgnify:CR=1 FL=1